MNRPLSVNPLDNELEREDLDERENGEGDEAETDGTNARRQHEPTVEAVRQVPHRCLPDRRAERQGTQDHAHLPQREPEDHCQHRDQRWNTRFSR